MRGYVPSALHGSIGIDVHPEVPDSAYLLDLGIALTNATREYMAPTNMLRVGGVLTIFGDGIDVPSEDNYFTQVHGLALSVPLSATDETKREAKVASGIAHNLVELGKTFRGDAAVAVAMTGGAGSDSVIEAHNQWKAASIVARVHAERLVAMSQGRTIDYDQTVHDVVDLVGAGSEVERIALARLPYRRQDWGWLLGTVFGVITVGLIAWWAWD